MDMDIQSLINEEIAEYIRKLDNQKKQVEKADMSSHQEKDVEDKLKKGLQAESERQKLFSLQARFLKEKVMLSKEKQSELRAKLDVVRKSKM
jgi:hypothetical protein